ncbi:hypothetical protein C0J52_21369, partial [Blattella germanica]
MGWVVDDLFVLSWIGKPIVVVQVEVRDKAEFSTLFGALGTGIGAYWIYQLSYVDLQLHQPYPKTSILANACPVCMHRLGSEFDLVTHMIKSHPGDGFHRKSLQQIAAKSEDEFVKSKFRLLPKRRSFCKVHKVSWNIAIESKGYVKCLFQNCNYLALTVDEMKQHYGICNGGGTLQLYTCPYVCPYCNGYVETLEKLSTHLRISHLTQALPKDGLTMAQSHIDAAKLGTSIPQAQTKHRNQSNSYIITLNPSEGGSDKDIQVISLNKIKVEPNVIKDEEIERVQEVANVSKNLTATDDILIERATEDVSEGVTTYSLVSGANSVQSVQRMEMNVLFSNESDVDRSPVAYNDSEWKETRNRPQRHDETRSYCLKTYGRRRGSIGEQQSQKVPLIDGSITLDSDKFQLGTQPRQQYVISPQIKRQYGQKKSVAPKTEEELIDISDNTCDDISEVSVIRSESSVRTSKGQRPVVSASYLQTKKLRTNNNTQMQTVVPKNDTTVVPSALREASNVKPLTRSRKCSLKGTDQLNTRTIPKSLQAVPLDKCHTSATKKSTSDQKCVSGKDVPVCIDSHISTVESRKTSALQKKQKTSIQNHQSNTEKSSDAEIDTLKIDHAVASSEGLRAKEGEIHSISKESGKTDDSKIIKTYKRQPETIEIQNISAKTVVVSEMKPIAKPDDIQLESHDISENCQTSVAEIGTSEISQMIIEQSDVQEKEQTGSLKIDTSEKAQMVVEQSDMQEKNQTDSLKIDTSQEAEKIVEQSDMQAKKQTGSQKIDSSEKSQKIVKQSDVQEKKQTDSLKIDTYQEAMKIAEQSDVQEKKLMDSLKIDTSEEAQKIIEQSDVQEKKKTDSLKNVTSEEAQKT